MNSKSRLDNLTPDQRRELLDKLAKKQQTKKESLSEPGGIFQIEPDEKLRFEPRSGGA